MGKRKKEIEKYYVPSVGKYLTKKGIEGLQNNSNTDEKELQGNKENIE